jgi:hemolysin activation/secretion protein
MLRIGRFGVVRACLSVLLLGAAAGTLHAAEPTDPQRIEERLPSEQPKPDVAAPSAVHVDDADLASIQPFDLKSVVVEGMTAIDRSAVNACTSELTGTRVGAAGLVGLTSCVTQLYRDRDYFLSRAIIPPQQVRDGVLTVRVIEGYIAAIQPEGFDQADADAQFGAALAERPLRLATFERSLLLLADRYGHRISSTRLAADENDPARFSLKLTVKLLPVTWRVFGDNRGDAFQGPEQALLAVSLNAPFGTDRIIAQLFTAPADRSELFFADIGYGRAWLNGDLWTEVGVSTSRSNSGDPFPLFASESERRYARLTVPVLRSREQSLWVRFQADARDTQLVVADGSMSCENTRVLRGSLSYTLVKGATRSDVTLEVSHGLDALDASQNGDANLSRPDARPQFTKTRLDVAITHNLFGQLDVAATGAGQWADGSLVASEEFGIGGSRFGRAYDYSEIVGDQGVAGAIELRWTWRKLNDWLATVQLFAFADAARVWNNGVASDSLTSAGGGIRVGVVPGISATVEVAKPLSRDVLSQGDRDARVFVSVSAGW